MGCTTVGVFACFLAFFDNAIL